MGARDPVWAWHSCGAWQHPPSPIVWRDLHGDYSKERGFFLLEIEVPSDRHTLLSDYGLWNKIYYHLCYQSLDEEPFSIPPELAQTVFGVRTRRGKAWGDDMNSDIQACLGYIDAAWVVSEKPLIY